MIKSIKKYNVWIFLGLFCMLYNPPILPINSMHVVGVISIFFLVRQNDRFPTIVCSKRVFKLFCAFGFIFIYLFAVATLSEKGDIGIALYPIYFLIDVIPFGLVLKNYSDRKNLGVDDFINLVLGCGMFQAVFAILALVFPAFQKFLIAFYIRYGYDELYAVLSAHRMYGFAGTLTFSTPVLQSVLAIIMLVYYRQKGGKYILGACLMCISAIVNARTSMIVIIIGIMVIILLSKLSLKYKVGFLVIIPLVFVFGITIVIPILSAITPSTILWVTNGLEEISNFFHGNVEEGYFSYLLDEQKYVLPQGILNMLFGEGHAVQGGAKLYGVSSDIGYVNDIWRGGIIYIILVYGYVLSKLRKMTKSGIEIIEFIGVFVSIVFLIVNIKGTMFSMNDLSNFVCILYMFIHSSCYDKKKNIL